MKVYKIGFKVDDFRSLLAKDPRIHAVRLLALDGLPKGHQWPRPLEAVLDNAEAPDPDIYSCEAGNMLITGKSLNALKPVLEPVAELLPVHWAGGDGYLVNVLGFSPCLDTARTKWHIAKSSGKKLFIRDYVFLPDMLPELVPFRIEAQRFATFCADRENGSPSFPALLDAHHLTGVCFEQVWSC